jgi:Lon protease-like protein
VLLMLGALAISSIARGSEPEAVKSLVRRHVLEGACEGEDWAEQAYLANRLASQNPVSRDMAQAT